MRKSNLYAVYTGLTIDAVNEEFINSLNLLYDVSTKVLLLDNNLICSNENFDISLSTEGMWDNITKFIKKNWNSFSKWVKDLWNKIFKSKEEIVKCEKDIVNKTSEMVAKGEQNAVKEVNNIVEEVTNNVNKAVNVNKVTYTTSKIVPNDLPEVSKKEIMELLGSNKDKLFAGVLPTKNYIKATKSVNIDDDVNILLGKLQNLWDIRDKLKQRLTKDQYEYLTLIGNKMNAQYKSLVYIRDLKRMANDEANLYMSELSKIRNLKNKRLEQGYITNDKIKEEYIKEFKKLRQDLKESINTYNTEYSAVNPHMNNIVDELSEVILNMDKVFK